MKDFMLPPDVAKKLRRAGTYRLVDNHRLYIAWHSRMPMIWSFKQRNPVSIMLGRLEVSFPSWRVTPREWHCGCKKCIVCNKENPA